MERLSLRLMRGVTPWRWRCEIQEDFFGSHV
jgi:hypothetical protein